MCCLCLDCLIHHFLWSSLFWLSAAKTRLIGALHRAPAHMRVCVRARLCVCKLIPVWPQLCPFEQQFRPMFSIFKEPHTFCMICFYLVCWGTAPQKCILALLQVFWSLISSLLLCLKAAVIRALPSIKRSDFGRTFSTETDQRRHNFYTQTRSVCMHVCVHKGNYSHLAVLSWRRREKHRKEPPNSLQDFRPVNGCIYACCRY